MSMSTDDLIVADFNGWVEAINDWADYGVSQTGDSIWIVVANVAIAQIINSGQVPVDDQAVEDAEGVLEAYAHVVPAAIDIALENNWLAVEVCDDGCGLPLLTYRIPMVGDADL